MNCLGQCEVLGYNCKYHYENFRLSIIPNEDEVLGYLYQNIQDILLKNNFVIRADSKISNGSYDLFICSRVRLSYKGEGLYLDVIYHFDYYVTSNIDTIAFYSDALTNFVEIPSYYFRRHQDGKNLLSTTDDLLYHDDQINEFSFNYEDKKIMGHVYIGNVLRDGIASDLKLKSRLELTFDPLDNNDYIIRLCEGVNKVLQFLCYEKEISFNRIELIGTHGNNRSILGTLYTPNKKSSYRYHIKSSSYLLLEEQLGVFFQGNLSDHNLYTKHLPKNNEIYTPDVIRFLNIFSAFENEFSKLPKNVRKKDDSKNDSIRKSIINKLNGMIDMDLSEEDVKFIQLSIAKIRELGKSYGERQKLSTSLDLFYDSLKSSFKHWGLKKDDIINLTNTLCDLRNKIVHNNFDGEIEEHSTRIYITILERLTYAMLLSRYGIVNIDEIISVTFY